MMAYLKDQLASIVFFYSQIALVMLIAQLASRINGFTISNGNLFYMVVIVSFFLLIYHIIRYLKFRDMYRFTSHDTTETAWLPDPPNQLTSQIKQHYEKQYDAYKQELEKLYGEKKQESMFMQQWVHQMKTPLSVMQLILEKEAHSMPHATKSDLEEELDRMKHGLQLALYQARLQQFERDFYVEKIRFRELVRSVIQDHKSSFIRNHVYPKVEIDDSVTIYSDPKWLRFVLEQITSNSIKYASGTKTQILYTVKNTSGVYQLQIKDEGIGIPPQDIKRIFDPFFTGHNGRHYQESTGMGLYLSKEICEALNHKISVHSKVNKGTSVMITFETG
ncbi:HAMP domain-containing histidine kinase [Gracilibacillus oryzae]|uniref:histidine kinase n=1 Tax=Gracilibacillus oryzae TaxID=1672701 RepID=A0A7C8GQA0_9BACI|nr:sensor histidine kinase [Gracilibacillus oryzae]KAB8125615.1 HAMP domain-containing histidine kinase [Gracilibacillus oryzae]